MSEIDVLIENCIGEQGHLEDLCRALDAEKQELMKKCITWKQQVNDQTESLLRIDAVHDEIFSRVVNERDDAMRQLEAAKAVEIAKTAAIDDGYTGHRAGEFGKYHVPLADGQEWWPVDHIETGDYVVRTPGGEPRYRYRFKDVFDARFVTAVWQAKDGRIFVAPSPLIETETGTVADFWALQVLGKVSVHPLKLLGVIMEKEAK